MGPPWRFRGEPLALGGSPTAGTSASCSLPRRKVYRCPGCNQEIFPRTLHVMVYGRRGSPPGAATGTRPAGSGASPSCGGRRSEAARQRRVGRPGNQTEPDSAGSGRSQPVSVSQPALGRPRRLVLADVLPGDRVHATSSWWSGSPPSPGWPPSSPSSCRSRRCRSPGRPSPCCSARPPSAGGAPWQGWCCTWPSGSPPGCPERRARAAPTWCRRPRSATSSGSWSRRRWSGGWPNAAGTAPRRGRW